MEKSGRVEGSRIINLEKLQEYINTFIVHAAQCGGYILLAGEKEDGFVSINSPRCSQCKQSILGLKLLMESGCLCTPSTTGSTSTHFELLNLLEGCTEPAKVGGWKPITSWIAKMQESLVTLQIIYYVAPVQLTFLKLEWMHNLSRLALAPPV